MDNLDKTMVRLEETTAPPLFHEYDIIFVGGGTAAGVAAGRLAAADASLRILIVETGPHTKDDPAHIQVGRFMTHLYSEPKTVKHVVGKPSEHLDGRQLVVQCGQCVGGASSVNFAMYTRPPASDYDDWAYLHDNPGWSFADLLPFIKNLETYQNAPNRPTHGYSGPIKVSYGGYRTNVGMDYVTTVAHYDKDRVVVDDANSMVDDVNRIEFWPKWIDQDTGRRSDVAHHFIYPMLEKSQNAHLLVECSVRRVIIENGRATGIEYIDKKNRNTVKLIRAKRLVVVSAGAFGSPAILERSGIGAKDVLDKNGIKQIVDLPGVGENYMDHILTVVPFNAKENSETFDGLVRGDPTEMEKWSGQWLKDGTGLLSSNGVDGGIKYRPSDEEVGRMDPELVERWTSLFSDRPDKSMFWVGILSQYLGFKPPASSHKCYCIGAYLMYPAGVGYGHITSADDVDAPADFDHGIFSRSEDISAMRYAYKFCREYGRRMSACMGEYVPDRPNYPAGSVAVAAREDGDPASIDAPDIVYTPEDDAAIDALLKENIKSSWGIMCKFLSAWHSMGTCSMKARDKGGVVDSRLNVYGVHGLKVADMSICPSNVGTNTYSTAMMIGEKAAALIAEDLGVTVNLNFV